MKQKLCYIDIRPYAKQSDELIFSGSIQSQQKRLQILQNTVSVQRAIAYKQALIAAASRFFLPYQFKQLLILHASFVPFSDLLRFQVFRKAECL
ncbi:MAG: hypothetical protein V4495_06105 [Pseudomonadota bacterium]